MGCPSLPKRVSGTRLIFFKAHLANDAGPAEQLSTHHQLALGGLEGQAAMADKPYQPEKPSLISCA